MDSDAELSYFLEKAMQEAEEASRAPTYPVGAIIVNPQGEIIGNGNNHVYDRGDYTSHAEMEAIRKAGKQLMKKENFNACTLYTTLEPCLMCCGAILLARIKRVVWVKNDDLYGALRCLRKQNCCQNGAIQKEDVEVTLLPDGYAEKINSLSIISEPERNLARKMDTWMEQWNAMKQARVTAWEEGKVEK